MWIKELLGCCDDIENALAAVKAAARADEYLIRFPAAVQEEENVRRFAMIHGDGKRFGTVEGKLPWYGFAFD